MRNYIIIYSISRKIKRQNRVLLGVDDFVISNEFGPPAIFTSHISISRKRMIDQYNRSTPQRETKQLIGQPKVHLLSRQSRVLIKRDVGELRQFKPYQMLVGGLLLGLQHFLTQLKDESNQV